MPYLTVNGETFEVAEGTRLVLAIENTGVNIGHRCGGNARCTTCRVEFEEGEPEIWTKAEYKKLSDKGELGNFRLSCQIECLHDMSVRPLLTVESEGWSDPGPTPDEKVQPEAVFYPLEELAE